MCVEQNNQNKFQLYESQRKYGHGEGYIHSQSLFCILCEFPHIWFCYTRKVTILLDLILSMCQNLLTCATFLPSFNSFDFISFQPRIHDHSQQIVLAFISFPSCPYVEWHMCGKSTDTTLELLMNGTQIANFPLFCNCMLNFVLNLARLCYNIGDKIYHACFVGSEYICFEHELKMKYQTFLRNGIRVIAKVIKTVFDSSVVEFINLKIL